MLKYVSKAIILANILGIVLIFVSFLELQEKYSYDKLANALGIVTVLLTLEYQVILRRKEISEIRAALVPTKAFSISKFISDLRSHKQPIHNSSSNLLELLALNELPSLAEKLSIVSKADRAPTVAIQDIATINLLLQEVAQQVPRNSVWLGLSKLQNPEAWSNENGHWNDVLMRRLSAQEVQVCRMWALQNKDNADSLQPIMRIQQNNGVIVRYLGSPISEGRPAPDLSLIWVPQANSSVKLSKQALEASPIDALVAAGYKPLSGMEFDVRSHILSKQAFILDEVSTRRCETLFTRLWEVAKQPPLSVPA